MRGLSLVLPEERARALERRRRGWEDLRRLRRADAVVVSYGKSGRTWLRALLSHYYHQACGIDDRLLLGFDNFHRLDRRVPRIFFTHDVYLADVTGAGESKRDYRDRDVLLMVRRPQDVVVSQYHQWRHRMRPHKKRLLRFPAEDEELSLFDFAMHPRVGLPGIVAWMNRWAAALPALPRARRLRYEDLGREPEAELARVLRFLGTEPEPHRVAEAVRFASAENLRALERAGHFGHGGSPVAARDKGNPDSYKVRRARAGGYREDFPPEELEAIDAFVRLHLSPVFGYGDELEGRRACR